MNANDVLVLHEPEQLDFSQCLLHVLEVSEGLELLGSLLIFSWLPPFLHFPSWFQNTLCHMIPFLKTCLFSISWAEWTSCFLQRMGRSAWNSLLGWPWTRVKDYPDASLWTLPLELRHLRKECHLDLQALRDNSCLIPWWTDAPSSVLYLEEEGNPVSYTILRGSTRNHRVGSNLI